MAEVTVLSMDAINVATGSLYVINNSDRGRSQAKGIIVFSVTEQDGSSVVVELPRTFIPLDLTQWASLDSIKQSTEFRALIRSGALLAIDSNDARKYLSSTAAAAEITRLRQDNKIVIGSVASKEVFNIDSSTVASSRITTPVQEEAATINPVLRRLVDEFQAGGDDVDLANQLRTLTNLTKEDLVWASEQIKATDSEFFLALADVDAPFRT